MNHPVTMYQFHVWANQRMFDRLKELPREIYTQEVQSIFPTISAAMAHIYMTDSVWMDILTGKSMSEALGYMLPKEKELGAKSLEELEAMYSRLAERFQAFLGQQEDLEQAIMLDNPYAGKRDTRLSEIVLQVVNHGTYHRGNVSAMLRQMGHASIMTEYALFWYQGESKVDETVSHS
ncbi:DinB family protein [Brevibacillus migulae]|uniref:DinB family protein n=1 Tax=Brevibacillus migulae TaxID=1644114 RepID=UPI00106E357E|nr:DinB family protein [Brevibacillus migulae]